MYLDRLPQIEFGLVQLCVKVSGLRSLVLQNEMNLHKSVGRLKNIIKFTLKLLGLKGESIVTFIIITFVH